MILLLLLVTILGGHVANGLTCYVCTGTTIFDPCVFDDRVAVGCPYKYCTIFRRELLDPPGILVAFMRSCQDNPERLNAEVNTTEHRTFYHACTTDLCNTGEGRLKPSSIKPIDEDTGIVLVVPGIGSSASALFALNGLGIVQLLIISKAIINNL